MVDEKGKVLGYQRLGELRERLKPVLLRRTRERVMEQLPGIGPLWRRIPFRHEFGTSEAPVLRRAMLEREREEARQRLWDAVASRQTPQEAAVAMQGLMEAARRRPAPAPKQPEERLHCP